MAIVSIQRALIRRKLESKRVDLSDPSKFAVKSFNFGEDDDDDYDLLSNSSLLDKSATMLSDASFHPPPPPRVDDESRDDGVDEEVCGERVREDERDTAAASPPLQALLTPAGTPVYGANLYNDPVNDVTVTNTPQSFLHGMVIIDDNEEVKTANNVHVQATPTPKKRAVVYQGKMFESSPITQPDECGEMQGLSFVDESLNYSINEDTTPQPTPIHHPESKKNSSSSSPSMMFASSPLTSEQDDSLLQMSMSSFIKNDDSAIVVERDLFDCSTKKEEEKTPMKTPRADTKQQLTATETLFNFQRSLQRTKPLITFSEDEFGDDLVNMSQLGIDTSEQQQQLLQLQHPLSTKEVSQASLSPTGVTDFFQDDEEDVRGTSSPPLQPLQSDVAVPLPPAAPSKTSFMTQLLDQLSACHHPCRNSMHTTTTKKQQQTQPDNNAAVDKSRIPEFVPKVYSPAQELSLARQRANSIGRRRA